MPIQHDDTAAVHDNLEQQIASQARSILRDNEDAPTGRAAERILSYLRAGTASPRPRTRAAYAAVLAEYNRTGEIKAR